MSAAAPQPVSPAAARTDSVGASALRKAGLRILPIISVGYGLAYMDRVNISFASLRMNSDLHFSNTVYGIGAGLFFIAYAICEIPSNLLLLRFGPRRWLARIMLTWGLLAAAMMFVRTPTQFYTVRFLLGMAEAGFFPGILYYLTLWFPANMRARAISRFYIALPLSSVVMGSLAGTLLGLNGKLGLAGWQWLFLLEGLPASVFSFVVLRGLPEGPQSAHWLTADEKNWIERRVADDAAQAHLGNSAGVLQTLMSPKVWLGGLFFFSSLTCIYGYGFSAPAIFQAATGWSVGRIGWLIAGIGLAGGLGMLLGGANSDRTGDRVLHCIVPLCVMACGYFLASYGRPAWLVIAALSASFVAFMALQGPALAIPTEFLAGRAAAAGIAAMNTITMFSGFLGPYWMGRMRDLTGSYGKGLLGLMLPALLAAVAMVVLTRSLARSKATTARAQLANEPA